MNSADCPFHGMLVKEDPLWEIFPDGRAPLETPLESAAQLGEIPEAQRCFMISLRYCTAEQKEKMAQDMVRRRQGSIEEARAFLAENQFVPARAFHFSGTTCPLRFLI